MSVQLIHCPECTFRLPYAVLGRQGSFRTGGEYASLCRHRPDKRSMDALDCPVIRAEAEKQLKIRLPDPPALPAVE
ncbi:MAG: hypothetical protein ABI639_01575 [Thermoanaerobaculia bacterium]